jgi:hypothetical protein
MREKQSLLIDVISILPNEVDCYIQAPSLEDDVILSLMNATKYDYYKCIKLTGATKDVFIKRINNFQVEEYFQSIEIRLNEKLLFEGYDGIKFGIISNSIRLPEWFINKYVKTGMCNTSNEW